MSNGLVFKIGMWLAVIIVFGAYKHITQIKKNQTCIPTERCDSNVTTS